MTRTLTTAGVAAGLLFSPFIASASDPPLLEGLAQIEESVRRPDMDLRTAVNSLGHRLASKPTLQGPSAVKALNQAVFGDLGLVGSANLKDVDNLLPSRVLERKRGYCVGIAGVYLLLAEQLHLPIYAVATPSHVFLR